MIDAYLKSLWKYRNTMLAKVDLRNGRTCDRRTIEFQTMMPTRVNMTPENQWFSYENIPLSGKPQIVTIERNNQPERFGWPILGVGFLFWFAIVWWGMPIYWARDSITDRILCLFQYFGRSPMKTETKPMNE